MPIRLQQRLIIIYMLHLYSIAFNTFFLNPCDSMSSILNHQTGRRVNYMVDPVIINFFTYRTAVDI